MSPHSYILLGSMHGIHILRRYNQDGNDISHPSCSIHARCRIDVHILCIDSLFDVVRPYETARPRHKILLDWVSAHATHHSISAHMEISSFRDSAGVECAGEFYRSDIFLTHRGKIRGIDSGGNTRVGACS